MRRRRPASATLVKPLVLDVSDHDAVVAHWPKLPPFYAVVNNAGYSEMGAVEEVTAAQARAQLDVNLIAPAVVASCALPAMRERGSGRIVMVSSMFGRAAIMPLNGWYHASKFGLEALSDVLRMEVAGFGVKVVDRRTRLLQDRHRGPGEGDRRRAPPGRLAVPRRVRALGAVVRRAWSASPRHRTPSPG